jgi:hypothetical protein
VAAPVVAAPGEAAPVVAAPVEAAPADLAPAAVVPAAPAPVLGPVIPAAVAPASPDLSDPAVLESAIAAARTKARELLAERLKDIEAAAQRAAAARISEELAAPRSCGYVGRIQKQPHLNAHQLRNVRAIVAVAKELDLPPRAAVIALATAQQESWLKNLSWGDRDSLGLFQQRPSMGWGSRSQVTDPRYAARAFYRALMDVDGWERLPVTVAAQRVQRSAFPTRYAQWELMSAKLVARTMDAPVTSLDCARR